MRKLFSLFVALLATTSLWAEDFSVDGIYYNYLNGNNVEVTHRGSYSSQYDNEYSGAVIIPSTVTHNGTTYSVTSIGDYAFSDCSSLTSVTIPNSVTSIEYYAFYDCSSLTSITIPNSVTSIGDDAFSYCSSLTSITIPNSVTSIGDDAFYYCSSLTSVTCLGTTPPTLGTDVFNGTKLSAVYIPENTLSAYQTAWGNEYVFVNNETTLTLHVATPGTLADLIFDAGTRPVLVAKLTLTGTLNDADFTCMRETMTSLVDVDLSGITNTSGVNFKGKSKLVKIILPANLTSIGSSAFEDCSSLTSITIGNSVTSIGDGAFEDCSSLTSITIGNSVASIGWGAFSGCSSLTSITIPNSVTSIGNSAFSSCSSLSSITIPNSVTYIGEWAFYDCSSLTSITIPNSVTSIGDRTFYYCSSLTSITIGNSVTSIGDGAFEDCSSLTSVTIGNSVTSIGYEAFDNCSSLASITIPNSVTSIGDYAFSSCSSLTSITIPNSVTSIGNSAFSGCSSLTSITIPNRVTSIGDYAFSSCSSLTSITIPNSVTSIGNAAFSDCSSLVSMIVESGNTKYDSRDNCNAIIETATNILIAGCQNTIIPNSVTSIGNSAFEDCSSLASITIPSSVTSIGDYAFSSCSSLTSITIPNSVTSIGWGAFSWCSSLTSITIPNSVTSIGHSAFSSCSSLTSITIPNSVTSIGDGAFFYCSSLTSITCEAATPPTISDTYTFYGVSKSIPVYVPCGCVEAYKAASGWSDFTNIQVPLLEYSIEVYVNDIIMGTTKVNYNTFCEGAQISATPNIGYYFVQWSDGVTDNPRTLELTQDTILTAEFAPNLVAEGLIVEDYFYPIRAGKYNLSNNWVSSVAEGNFIAPGTELMVRGMAMKDGVMYFINRELSALVPVDVATGKMGEPIVITGEHLFEAETEVEGVMEWKSAVTLPFNDVKVDHAGNVLIGACLTNAQTFFVYKVNLETGEATEIIKERLYDNPEFDGMEYRFDAFGVYGDVDGNACIMAANGNGMDVYRWIIEDGVAGKAERILIQLDPELDQSYNINATSLGVPSQIYPQDEEGILFYVDGKDLYPMLIDEVGMLLDDMINIPTGLAVGNNPGDTLIIDGAANGMIEFQVGDEYFFLMAASNFNKSIPATFALFKFADADRSFAGLEPLWYFPAKGLGDGTTKNACFTAPVSVAVDGNTATIAVYSQNLGYASYTLTIGETVQTHQLMVLSNDNAMGSVSGSGTYKQGQSVTISATANDGYHFSHWNDGNTENPRVVEITQDTTFTAYFKDNLYTISVDANNSEAGFTQGSGTYKYGTYTEISATANNGYHFSHWNDGETTNPRVIQVTSDMTYTAYFYKNTYTVSVDYNSAYGTVAGPTSGEYLDEITLTATPNLGYAFVKWSDGVITNPRTIVLTKDMTLSAHFAQAYSGQCGNDLYWKYDPDAQTIAITGSGEMYHYTASTQPWILFKEQIRKVEISNEATSLGTSAFEGCRSLGEVHIGLNLLDIYENAFAGCKRLYYIYSYPTYPPFADVTSFANYSADLHIPCEAKELYVRDEVWGLFNNIQCLGAETEDVPSGEVTTTTTSTSVTITWPTDENADSYTIEIKRGDQVFCTLTFSKDGQLTNIAFAPSRDGQHRAQYAELTANGLRFTVTNLNSGTQYSYDVTTKDENDEVIESYSGEFTTKSDVATDMDAVTATDNRVQKLFRNGQLIILRDGVEYNAMGQELGN